MYGLEAISGVAAELLHRRGDRVHWSDLALVSGACAYDFASRSTSAYSTMDLGRAALLDATTPEVPVGRRGAGSATLVGAGIPGLQPEPGGQGAAAAVLGELAVAVVTVVNASARCGTGTDGSSADTSTPRRGCATARSTGRPRP